MATTSNFGWPTPDDTDLVRNGADAIRGLGDAIDTTVAAGFRYVGTRYYTSSGIFEKANPLLSGDIGLRAIRVRVQGAGGGGGSNTSTLAGATNRGSGGAGGGYAESFISDLTALTASEDVTVGAGGTAGTGGDGGAGGGSSLGSLVVAPGGGSGRGNGRLRLPSTSGTGDLFVPGGVGMAGDGGATSTFRLNGFGGGSVLGQGGAGFWVGEANGSAGFGFGAGGGGNDDSQTAYAGAPGIVIVEVFV